MDIEKAIREAGSVSALSRILKVTRTAVQLWQKSGKLPAARVEALRSLRPEWFLKK